MLYAMAVAHLGRKGSCGHLTCCHTFIPPHFPRTLGTASVSTTANCRHAAWRLDSSRIPKQAAPTRALGGPPASMVLPVAFRAPGFQTSGLGNGPPTKLPSRPAPADSHTPGRAPLRRRGPPTHHAALAASAPPLAAGSQGHEAATLLRPATGMQVGLCMRVDAWAPCRRRVWLMQCPAAASPPAS